MWDIAKLQQVYGTDIKEGLTSHQALTKLKEKGENILTEKVGIPWYCVFLKDLTNFFAILLWTGSFLCFIGYGIQKDKTDKSNLSLGFVIALIVIMCATFSYLQSSKVASIMADFKNFIPREALVIRDGQAIRIESKNIVPGDVIQI